MNMVFFYSSFFSTMGNGHACGHVINFRLFTADRLKRKQFVDSRKKHKYGSFLIIMKINTRGNLCYSKQMPVFFLKMYFSRILAILPKLINIFFTSTLMTIKTSL
jgi:hypothetical protein